ncbi:hypothetical protein PVAP13_2KG148016 [Panicum virgatum]|uniref:Uncharacterized protein n=1 Tax=Panicum virgatum TaxID=38727 RepID=A0A8T0W5A9_PANVG|nr:hypothetical protein PVAP13_2KG148016 [Panicum virgatum]
MPPSFSSLAPSSRTPPTELSPAAACCPPAPPSSSTLSRIAAALASARRRQPPSRLPGVASPPLRCSRIPGRSSAGHRLAAVASPPPRPSPRDLSRCHIGPTLLTWQSDMRGPLVD